MKMKKSGDQLPDVMPSSFSLATKQPKLVVRIYDSTQ